MASTALCILHVHAVYSVEQSAICSTRQYVLSLNIFSSFRTTVNTNWRRFVELLTYLLTYLLKTTNLDEVWSGRCKFAASERARTLREHAQYSSRCIELEDL